MKNQLNPTNSSSSNDNYYTGYKIFDEPEFGKSSLERLKKQPDYRANIIWPFYNYFQVSDYKSTQLELQKLLECYETKKCIDETNCLYITQLSGNI